MAPSELVQLRAETNCRVAAFYIVSDRVYLRASASGVVAQRPCVAESAPQALREARMTEQFPHSQPKHPHGLRRDDADAFFPDPGAGPALAPDDLAEELAEEFLASATMGQGQGEEGHEQFVDEEIGGPFVQSGGREFAHHPSGWSLLGAERESSPTPGPVPQDSSAEDDD